ncbi:DUF305 domain-containing protein [Nocardioides lijunqiniae]|uniref:DUF305 domain-containing protein n=1 Tax=Nocardioides lijunqiniae TaxID=2760832 RepID=UPI0018784411|nr:DUF305 domain-containing protein [Nocardioides lijunqiniae]
MPFETYVDPRTQQVPVSAGTLNAADDAFLRDVAGLLHQGVRMSAMAADRSPCDEVQTLARGESTAQSAQVAAVEHLAHEGKGAAPGPSVMQEWMRCGSDNEELAQTPLSTFDDVYLAQQVAQHYAVIERCDPEMIVGLSEAVRTFSDSVVRSHTAGLDHIHEH